MCLLLYGAKSWIFWQIFFSWKIHDNCVWLCALCVWDCLGQTPNNAKPSKNKPVKHSLQGKFPLNEYVSYISIFMLAFSYGKSYMMWLRKGCQCAYIMYGRSAERVHDMFGHGYPTLLPRKEFGLSVLSISFYLHRCATHFLVCPQSPDKQTAQLGGSLAMSDCFRVL